jgi:23S rRNA (uridine2552-2'-O)-methyltransferase
VARYQPRDAFHQRAKREGYRSRAAYKLEEIQQAQRLLGPGARVVELGCWPGGWLQVASRAVGPRGRVVGLDLAEVEPLADCENVIALSGDITEAPDLERVLEALGGPADVLLSDAAPKLTGVRATDRAREEALLEAIADAVPRLLAPGGALLVKLLECPEAQDFQKRMRGLFATTKVVKPKATRKGSSERYLLGRGFQPG